MRTKPGRPVELAGRWGRVTRREFAGWRFIDTTADTSERSVQRDRLALYRHHRGHKKGHSPRQASEDDLAWHHQKTSKVVSYEKRLRGEIIHV